VTASSDGETGSTTTRPTGDISASITGRPAIARTKGFMPPADRRFGSSASFKIREYSA